MAQPPVRKTVGVIDGQGGGIGSTIIKTIKAHVGETVEIVMSVLNTSLDATGVAVLLLNDDPYVVIDQDMFAPGDLATGETTDNEDNPFSFTVSEEAVSHPSVCHVEVSEISGIFCDALKISISFCSVVFATSCAS